MSKLLEYLTGSDGKVYHVADVATLQEAIPEIAHLPATLVERMYSDYSDSYAAGWLIVDESSIQSFRDWLLL